VADETDLPTISTFDFLRPTLARVSLWSADPDRLERFFVGLFGFRRVALATLGPDGPGAAIVAAWKLPPGKTVQIVMLRAPRGATELAIAGVPGWPMEQGHTIREGPPQAGGSYLVLYVPDLDAVIDRCEAQGVTFNRPPKRLEGPDGTRYYEMAIYDPDGRVLLVVEDMVPVAA
jgi:catechol 2,3-dioxygenase-like lactoylglutathione lyase family enzyme